ncbi:MAG: VOC family protein [Actinobacteria bacterium]|nr:VOC family protein [Actinomycetota bacterium]
MTVIRRLDHVAIAVRDTDAALRHFRDRFGLEVPTSEVIERPKVRLTYLDCGNAAIQLVEPLDDSSPLAEFLTAHGEGFHHICFGVDDVTEGAAALSPGRTPPATIGSGRGRPSAFVTGDPPCGARIEVTQFDHEQDVDASTGMLDR